MIRLSLLVILMIESLWGLTGCQQTISEPPTSKLRIKACADPFLESVVTVSLDHLKAYGVIIPGRTAGDSLQPVPFYSAPDTTTIIGSIRPLTFVSYERLSELTLTPYWGTDQRLEQGEWFRCTVHDTTGWLPAHQLMTFSSLWREESLERYYRVVDHRLVFCVYSSGQYEDAETAILTVWEKEVDVWVLQAWVVNPIEVGLYMIPEIEQVIERPSGEYVVELSAIGSDAGEVWGSRAWYQYREKQLLLEKREEVHEGPSKE